MSRTAPEPAMVEERARARAAMDRSQAWLLIGLGIPFALAGMFFLQIVLGIVIFFIPFDWSFMECLSIAGFLVLVAVAVDVWRHPSEHWVRTRYTLTGGGTSEPEFHPATSDIAGGAFSGMPLMTNMSDPANAGARLQAVANGCGNVVLAGPRNIRKGVELLLLSRARSKPESLEAATRFLDWLAQRDPLLEKDLPDEFDSLPHLTRGFIVADDLDFLVRRKNETGRIIDLREVNP